MNKPNRNPIISYVIHTAKDQVIRQVLTKRKRVSYIGFVPNRRAGMGDTTSCYGEWENGWEENWVGAGGGEEVGRRWISTFKWDKGSFFGAPKMEALRRRRGRSKSHVPWRRQRWWIGGGGR